MSTAQEELQYIRGVHADERRQELLGEWQFEDRVIAALKEGRKILGAKAAKSGVKAIYDAQTSTIRFESPETRAEEIEPALELKFRSFANQWREETAHISSITKLVMHPY